MLGHMADKGKQIKAARTRITGRGWVAVAVVLLVGFEVWSGALLTTGTLLFLRANVVFVLLIAVVLGSAGWGLYRAEKKQRSRLPWFVALVALAATAIAPIAGSYALAAAYRGHVEITLDDIASYAERAPFGSAKAQIGSVITDTAAEIGNTKYVPGASSNTYTTIVADGNYFGGYKSVATQVFDASGSHTSSTCRFSAAAPLALKNFLINDLNRVIRLKAFGAFWSAEDIYGFCDGDTPKIVVPLKHLAGFWPVIEVPAGVAIYDGHSGELDVVSTVEPGRIPGPVYPMSLSQQLRDSTATANGFWSWLRDLGGYRSAVEDTPDDPNRENPGEFVLLNADEKGVDIVTLLREAGGSTAITAIGVQRANAVTAGELGQFRIHQLPQRRVASTNLVQNIKSIFPEAPWQVPGTAVLELVPAGKGIWVATIGQPQIVNYRVFVDHLGGMCLVRPNKDVVRCVDEKGAPTGDAPPAQTAPPSGGTDLTKLSKAELAELARRVIDELAKRP